MNALDQSALDHFQQGDETMWNPPTRIVTNPFKGIKPTSGLWLLPQRVTKVIKERPAK